MSQNRAEDLDDDKLGGDYPPEQPLGVDEYGTTAAEEEVDEPLEERLAREEPDTLAPLDDTVDPGVSEAEADIAQEHEAPLPAEEAAIHVVLGDEV